MKCTPIPRTIRVSLFACLLTLALVQASVGQVLLQEDFSYAPGSPLSANGWTAHSGAGTSPIVVSNQGLTYPGYAGGGIGLGAGPLATSGEDDNRTFTQQTSGTVYAAAMISLNASQTTGDYFLHLAQAPVSSTFPGRVFARMSGLGYQLGLSLTTETPTYSPTVYPLFMTVLVILKYEFNAGANNDRALLFINPPLGGSEPPASVTAVNPLTPDAVNIGGIALRQGTAAAAPRPIVDGIRVGLTWADAAGAATTWTITSSAASGGTIQPLGATSVLNGGGQTYTIIPEFCHRIANVLVDGLTIGAAPTYRFNNVTAPHTIVASFEINTYKILASAGAGGSISPSGNVGADCGSDPPFTIAPDPGFAVLDVLVDGVSVGPVTSYTFMTVGADHDIAAYFASTSEPSLTFEQLDFDAPGGDVVSNSDIGRCSFAYTPIATEQFINVRVRVTGVPPGLWAVRNLYLPDAASAPPTENLSSRFPLNGLGVTVGLPLVALEYDIQVTASPMSDADAALWLVSPMWRSPVTVAHALVDVGGASGTEASITATPELLSWFPIYIPPLPINLIEWIGCKMINIDLDDSTHPGDASGCVPASCANSLTWLETEHPEISIPGDVRDAFAQLSNLMNRMAGQGATTEEMIRAKLDFIEAYGLPIRVDFQSVHIPGSVSSTSGKSQANNHDASAADWPTVDFLDSEAAHHEDVELFGGYYYHDGAGWHRVGGHAVVVTAVGSIGGHPFVGYKHDRKQKTADGTVQEGSGIDVVGGAIHLPGLDGVVNVGGVPTRVSFWLEGVVGESYDASVTAPGSSESFGDYCKWIIRTIRPGAKLMVTYPHGNRCYNSTVYVQDRTVKPPKWRKVRVWNFNSDSTRVYVNDSPYCVSVAIHNDDHTYSGGTYVPYDVGLSALPVGTSATSAGNPGAYGGFSLGGADLSSAEFGAPAGISVSVDASEGMDLSLVPGRMGGGGIQQLELTHPIPQWSSFWGHLELRLEVRSVTSPGSLEIACPASAFSGAILIDHAGLYVVDLGTVAPASQFTLALATQPGLEFELDALGVPSLVVPALAVPNTPAPLAIGLWNLGPNPATNALRLRFDLPRESDVDLSIFDVTGARVSTVASGRMGAGSHTKGWNVSDGSGRRVAPGLYFGRLNVDGKVWTTRLVIVR